MLDLQKFIAGLHDYIAKAFQPLVARLEGVEGSLVKQIHEVNERVVASVDVVRSYVDQRFADLPVPKDGTSVTVEEVSPLIEDAVTRAVAALPVPKDGQSVTLEELTPLCEQLVKQLVAAIPVPKDGESVTPEQVLPELKAQLQSAIEAIPVPKDGKSVTLDEVVPALHGPIEKAAAESAARAVEAIPRPSDGKSVTVDEVLPTLRIELQKAVDAIPKPKDGTSVTAEQVLPQLTAEVQKAIQALPVPKDGHSVTVDDFRQLFEAEQAKWALDFERRAQDQLQRAIDRMPKPKYGRDALDLEHFDIKMADDERTLIFSLTRGDNREERRIVLQHPLYRGVWRQGDFRKGDCVTYGGSSWIAVRDTASKPEVDDSWRLSVKRGRDGKGEKGEKGDPGKVVHQSLGIR
jgi:hypothetical protein